MALYVGTSGFAYPTWKPAFYPADLPATKFLANYSERLTAVEINYTFRRLTSDSLLSKWIKETRDGFQFAPKAHMRITHNEKLRDSSGFFATFQDSLEPLRQANRLGPVLVQLPPQFVCDTSALSAFLVKCRADMRFAFEFRHRSWFNDEVYGIARGFGAALCFAETEDLRTPPVRTAPFAYYRMRKPPYSTEQLEHLADAVRAIDEEGQDAYVFFQHEDDPRGALYAEALLRILERGRPAA